jgi:hypothetical protein
MLITSKIRFLIVFGLYLTIRCFNPSNRLKSRSFNAPKYHGSTLKFGVTKTSYKEVLESIAKDLTDLQGKPEFVDKLEGLSERMFCFILLLLVKA